MHIGTTGTAAEGSKPKGVPLIVIETKHRQKLELNTTGQAIAYYSHSKQGLQGSQCSGVAFLFNEYDGTIQFRIILFPYTRQPDSKSGVFGAQALLLPIITKKYDAFIQDVIKLICIICGQIDRKLFVSAYLVNLI